MLHGAWACVNCMAYAMLQSYEHWYAVLCCAMVQVSQEELDRAISQSLGGHAISELMGGSWPTCLSRSLNLALPLLHA